MFSMKFLLLQTLRLASQATSLYTREAHYRPTVHLKGVTTVHLKGVTHYTLQGKAREKEYEQMPVLLLFFRQVKPALWKAPLAGFFFLFSLPRRSQQYIYRRKHICARRFGAHYPPAQPRKRKPAFRCKRSFGIRKPALRAD